MASSNKSVFLRQQLLIDSKVQGALLARTAFYTTACVIYFMVIMVFTATITSPNKPLSEIIIRCLDEAVYWAPGLLLLGPLVAYDLLKLTSRFAGPAFRLRREMERLVAGESQYPLNFREGDENDCRGLSPNTPWSDTKTSGHGVSGDTYFIPPLWQSKTRPCWSTTP